MGSGFLGNIRVTLVFLLGNIRVTGTRLPFTLLEVGSASPSAAAILFGAEESSDATSDMDVASIIPIMKREWRLVPTRRRVDIDGVIAFSVSTMDLSALLITGTPQLYGMDLSPCVRWQLRLLI